MLCAANYRDGPAQGTIGRTDPRPSAADLFSHFRSAEQRLLADISRHSAVIVQLAGRLRAALRQGSAAGGLSLAQNAAQAKPAESRADEIVREMRVTARRIPGMETFCRILEVADDAADALEEWAFLRVCSPGAALMRNRRRRCWRCPIVLPTALRCFSV
ncbi:MAG: hypothetical protein JO081_02110 [Alphaproteobacteria bacterium]|nr:hypothetical protein [Alphaproteobacteria bacterium]